MYKPKKVGIYLVNKRDIQPAACLNVFIMMFMVSKEHSREQTLADIEF